MIDLIANSSLKRINKEVNYSPISFATVRGGAKGERNKHQGLLVLFDTGCSHSMLSAAVAKHVRWTRSETSFNTAAGQYDTSHKATVLFTLPEFSESKNLRWEFHLDSQKDSKNVGYDMIIGRDLMQELGLNIDFASRTVSWEGSRVAMRDFFDDSRKYRELHMIMQQSTEPDSVKNQTDHVVRILDAHYEAADLKYICMEKAIHLNIREREKLYKLLSKYESLFDGTLGDWGEDEAVELELQSGVKPHHSRPYRTPYIYRALFK
jgi:hypothetical protein